MKTLFLGTDEVTAYLTDLLNRFDPMPTVWCPITRSGRVLTAALVKVVGAHRNDLNPRILPIDLGPDPSQGPGEQILFREDPADAIRGQSILLLDGAIHSGTTMARCMDAILKYGPHSVNSYALVVKRCSVFIPTVWGVMTDETDRAHFLLEKIPNNRLHSGKHRPQPPVCLRRLDDRHVGRPAIVSGLASMDRMTWGDRIFQMRASDGAIVTYVLELADRIVGYLTVQIADGPEASLTVAEVAVSPAERKNGYAALMMRFADTLARQSECKKIVLNAIADRVGMYTGWGYRVTPGKSIIRLDNEEYQPMDRDVMYHHAPHEQS